MAYRGETMKIHGHIRKGNQTWKIDVNRCKSPWLFRIDSSMPIALEEVNNVRQFGLSTYLFCTKHQYNQDHIHLNKFHSRENSRSYQSKIRMCCCILFRIYHYCKLCKKRFDRIDTKTLLNCFPLSISEIDYT